MPGLRDICTRLCTTEAELRRLVHAPYFRREVDKPRGGKRVVWSPCQGLRAVQTRLLPVLHDTLRVHDAATGFVKGRGPCYNAKRHAGAKLLLQTDVVAFYEAIDSRRVADAMIASGVGATAAYLLAELCTRSEGARHVLVQGASTSPVLANAVCYELDAGLQALAAWSGGGVYTRYADDITISWQQPGLHFGVDAVEAALARAGFVLNSAKTRFVTQAEPMRITGLLINPAPGRPAVRAPRNLWRRLRVGTHVWQLDGGEQLRKEMQGLASFLLQTDAVRATQYLELLR